MKASEVKKALKMMIPVGKKQKITPFIIGKPGIGKSHIVKQVATELGLDFIDVRLSQIDNTDLKGIPSVDKSSNSSKWYSPEFLPTENNPRFHRDGKPTKGILFLDEFNRAAPDVSQSSFQLVYDYCVGDNKILDSWYIVAAGNMGAEDNCDVNEFDAALNGRLVYLHLEENIKEWVSWAQDNNICPEIIGFINSNSKFFYHEVDKSKNMFITPRRWAQFSNVIQDNLEDMSIKEVTALLGSSMINGAAPVFLNYLTEIESISGEDVLKNFPKIADRIKAYEISRLTQLNDNLVETLKKREKSTKKTKITTAELENMKAYMSANLADDILLGLWQKCALEAPEIGIEFGKTFPEFDKYLANIIIKSLNVSPEKASEDKKK